VSVLRIASLFPLLLAMPALAQDDPPKTDPKFDPAALDGDSLTVGLGLGAVPSYEGSNDTVLAVVPGLRGTLAGIDFNLRGNRFWADVIPSGNGPGWDFQLGPIAQVNFNRSAAIVDKQVKKLPKLDMAVELGGYVGIGRRGLVTSDYDQLNVTIGYVHDVVGTHGSYVLTPSIDYSTPLSTKSYVALSFSGDYMGDGYARTYFGVDAAGSAASGLPVFSARKGWKDWTVSLLGDVSITGDLTHGLSALAAVSYRRMLDDAAASPVTSIAGSRDQWVGMAGLAYTF
jgi:outer membrane scaffolding protein for murein synthesis (MipA/OmpV family)